jgi:hypothetical protein
LSIEVLTPEIFRSREISAMKFDLRSAALFINKSVSETTRRAYGRAVADFFRFADGKKHPIRAFQIQAHRFALRLFRVAKRLRLWSIDAPTLKALVELAAGHAHTGSQRPLALI